LRCLHPALHRPTTASEMSGDVATPDDTTDTPDAGIEMT
jgi:hypothetical protein